MLVAITIFLVGLICGLAAGKVQLGHQRKKIKFYETFIHQRLQETLPPAIENLGPR